MNIRLIVGKKTENKPFFFNGLFRMIKSTVFTLFLWRKKDVAGRHLIWMERCKWADLKKKYPIGKVLFNPTDVSLWEE